MTEQEKRLPLPQPTGRVTSEQQEHIDALFDHFNWLRTHGWQEAMYAPRDGTEFECIEVGSTGIHRVSWLLNGFLIDGDWPTRFILWRPLK